MAARHVGACVVRVWRDDDGHMLAQITHASGPDSVQETVSQAASSARTVELLLNDWISVFLAAHG
jgi:hypothetical protein